MGQGPAPRGRKWLREKAAAPWSPRLAKAILERVAQGELLYVVLREAGMPTPQSVGRWAKARPEFGAALAKARLAGGRSPGKGGGVWGYCQEMADAVFERLSEGESLTSICADPTMPSMSTVFYWRRRFPEFDEAVRVARAIQAERLCDLGWEAAQDATPETAYLTHVRLTQLRWTCGVMAPRAYRPRLVEPQGPREELSILMRKFTIEEDPATGKKKVVAWCPDPQTGEVIREDMRPDWRPPPGCQPMPA